MLQYFRVRAAIRTFRGEAPKEPVATVLLSLLFSLNGTRGLVFLIYNTILRRRGQEQLGFRKAWQEDIGFELTNIQ